LAFQRQETLAAEWACLGRKIVETRFPHGEKLYQLNGSIDAMIRLSLALSAPTAVV
jgi:hypothetical protein